MAIDKHTNFAYSTVASAPSPATSGTSLDVQTGDGALFPIPPFNATIWPTGANPLSTNAEIVTVTGISTDTFTIVRTKEGTPARTVVTGDQIAANITAKTLVDVEVPPIELAMNFANDSKLQASTDGSGTTSTNGNGAGMDVNAAAGYAQLGYVTPDFVFDGNPRMSICVRPADMATANANEMYWGMGNISVSKVTGHDFTQSHIGFKFVVESGTWKLRATQADGTETASSVLTSAISSYDFLFLRIVKYGTSAVDYYWKLNNGAWSDATTLTTHIPTDDKAQVQFSISNVNSTDHVSCLMYLANYFVG